MVDRVVGSREVHEDSTGDKALLLKPSSMCSVRFSRWLVHDFPGRNLACSGISFASTCSSIRFEQLVGVAEQGDRSEALRNAGWVLSRRQ